MTTVDTTPVDQLLASLGYALGQIEAKAIIAVTRASHADVITDERDDLLAALREIRDIARNAVTTKPAEAVPAPAGVAGYPIGTRHDVVAVQQPGGGA